MPTQQFRKKPVVIEAMPWTSGAQSATPVIEWILNAGGTSRYVGEGEGHHLRRDNEDVAEFIVIDTLEDPHRMDPGDIAIQGVAREFYPCKPDIFDQTYEAVTTE